MSADPRILVRPTPVTRVVIVTLSPPWRPCPTCWGQQRIYAERGDGPLVWVVCWTCIGVGSVPST